MENDVYKRWKALGLLDWLDESKAVGLAEEYEKLAEYLQLNVNTNTLEDMFGNIKNDIYVIAFPVLRRAFTMGLNEKYSPRALCEKIKNEFDQEVRKIREKSMTNIDAEAEAAAEFAKYFSRNKN